MPDEADQAALEVEVLLARGLDALVQQADVDALVEVGRLAQPLGDRLEAEVQGLEDLGVRLEHGGRAVTPVRGADRRNRAARLAAVVVLRPDLAVASRLDVQPLGQRVDDADADAVEAAGDLVAAAAELAAGVEHGVDDLQGVLAGLLLPADRHAAAVVDCSRRCRPP